MIEGELYAIREIQCSDHKELALFFEKNNTPEITRKFHPFPLTDETAHRIACDNHLDLYYGAIINETVVGLCMLRGWDEGFNIPSFGILIDNEYQGRGLGRIMTEFVVSEARRLACPGIRLSVYASNKYAVHLYRSLGFNEAKRELVQVSGDPDIKIVMIKTL